MEIDSYQSTRSVLKLYFAFGEQKNKKVEETERRRKPLIICSSSTSDRATILTGAITIALTSLLIIGGFLLIITPPLMASALVREGITTISTTTGAAATTANTTTEVSPQGGIESASSPSQPNVNVTEIPVSKVNGTYVNPNIGFQIDLPTGWKGIEINFLVYSVIAAPGDTNLLEQLALEEPSTYISTMGLDEEGINVLENVSELVSLRGAAGGIEEETLLQGSSDPLGTNTTMPFDDNAVSCTYLQPSFVIINGINAEERLGECIDEGEAGAGTIAKTKSYSFATQNNSLIVVGFYANSTATFDLNLPLFEESARTISISRPADIATSEIYNRYKELVESQQLSNQTGGRM